MNAIAPIPQNGTSVTPLTKGEVFKHLNANIPMNTYRLPDFIYRADLVPQNVLEESPGDRALILDGAAMEVTFDHGYPAVGDERPMWEQLIGEPDEAYGAYMAYLELPEKSNHDNPIRLLPIIAALTKKPLKAISDWCHLYYWHWRARAYDLFLVAAHRKQREQRIMTIEGKHFKMAEDLLEKVNAVAKHKIEAEIAALKEDPNEDTPTTFKELIDIATKLVAVQRISLGMPANGPERFTVEHQGPRYATANETFKHIANEGSAEEPTTQRSAEMDTLLQNPDDLSNIQELMIKLNSPQHTLPAWGNGKVIDPNDSETVVEDLGNPDA